MKEPELSFFQQLIAFAALAGLGGIVNYLTTIKAGKKFKWPSFFIELICSAFVGDGWLIGIGAGRIDAVVAAITDHRIKMTLNHRLHTGNDLLLRWRWRGGKCGYSVYQ